MKQLVIAVIVALVLGIVMQGLEINHLRYLNLRNGAEIDRCMDTLRTK